MRTVPHNLEAEQSVLGSILLDPACFDNISDRVKDVDFYKSSNKRLFFALAELNRENKPIDLVSVCSYLRDRGELDAMGGSAYLATLVDMVPSPVHVEYYAKLVKEKSTLRKMLEACNRISERIYGQDVEEIEKFLSDAEEAVFSVGEESASTGPIPSHEIIKSSLEHLEKLSQQGTIVGGISTGFVGLDRLTSGLWPGDLVVVGARPSMGKTSFCMNIAQHVAMREGKAVVVFSLEMDRHSLMARILSSEARVPFGELRVGRIGDQAWPKLIGVADKISQARLFIDDTGGLDPYEVRSRCRRLKAKYGLDLVIVDYLQIMNFGRKTENHQLAIAEISKNMKALAKELQVPVIVLSQLSRASERRDDKRPGLSDLRDSGSIEQDADLVAFIYRDEYYEKENTENRGEVEIIVAKQRNGALGTVKLGWLGQYCTFVNPANSF